MISRREAAAILVLGCVFAEPASIRDREKALKASLFALHTAIDQYTFDKQKGPRTLQDVVDAGYLKAIPVDPMTGSAATWRIEMEDVVTAVSQTEPGIFDVRSASRAKSLDGTPYSEW